MAAVVEQRPEVASTRPLLRGLTGVRALAAAWVVLDHFKEPLTVLLPALLPLRRFFAAGYLGVEIFFVLSGFIIAYTYADRFRSFSARQYREYLELRFARVYPVHLATLLATGLLVVGAGVAGVQLASPVFTPLNFGSNLLLLQAVPPFGPFNLPSWSISCEAAAYLVFPLLALVASRISTSRDGFAAAGGIAVLGTALMLLVGATIDPSQLGYPLIWIRIATEFSCGVLLWAGWRWLGDRRHGAGWDLAVVGAAASTVGVLAFIDTESFFALALTPVIALFVLGSAGASGAVGRLLGARPLVWGGKVSYSLYLTHFLVLTVLSKVLSWEQFVGASLAVRVAVVLVYLIAVSTAACAAYYLIEEPGRRFLRRLTAREEGTLARPPVEVRISRARDAADR